MKITNIQELKAELVAGKWQLKLLIESGFQETDDGPWLTSIVTQNTENEDFYEAYANALVMANEELFKDADNLSEQDHHGPTAEA